MLHQVTGHAGQQLMMDTAKYYGVQVMGGHKVFELFFREDQTNEYSHEE